MIKDVKSFRFRWQRVAPDEDDFLGCYVEDENLSARIHRAQDAGVGAWQWVAIVNGQAIGAGVAADPRAAAFAAEEAYFTANSPDDHLAGKAAPTE